MFKKFIQTTISIILVFMLIGVTSIVQAADSADDVNIEPTQLFTVYIDTTNCTWNNFSEVYLHIYGKDGERYAFGARKERCTYEGNNIWKYENEELNYLLDDDDYLIFFYNNYYKTTNEILFDKTCVGDTVYFDGTMTTNYEYYQRPKIFWKNHDNSKYASILRITSSGEVTGNYCLSYMNPYDMFIDFLKSSYSTAITNSNKDEQTFINEIGYKLGLSGIEVERAIIYSGKNIKWYREYYIEPTTPLPSESTTPTETQSQKILGDVDGDGEVTIVDTTCIQRYLCQLPVYAEGIGEPIK